MNAIKNNRLSLEFSGRTCNIFARVPPCWATTIIITSSVAAIFSTHKHLIAKLLMTAIQHILIFDIEY